MSRTHLDKELHELNNQIVQLGSLVDDALAKALEALKTGDLAKCGLVIEADVTVDGLRAAVEEHTIRLLTLQQPLGGRDLRFLTSAFCMAFSNWEARHGMSCKGQWRHLRIVM